MKGVSTGKNLTPESPIRRLAKPSHGFPLDIRTTDHLNANSTVYSQKVTSNYKKSPVAGLKTKLFQLCWVHKKPWFP